MKQHNLRSVLANEIVESAHRSDEVFLIDQSFTCRQAGVRHLNIVNHLPRSEDTIPKGPKNNVISIAGSLTHFVFSMRTDYN